MSLSNEVERLRAWLRLIEATTDPENAYYALHGYDAPADDWIERDRVHREHVHPANRAALPGKRRHDDEGRPLCFGCGTPQSAHPRGVECAADAPLGERRP